jgi:hypothetical protein
MSRKPKPTQDHAEQSRRFIKTGRKVGVHETEGIFEEELRKTARAKPPLSQPSGRRARSNAKPSSDPQEYKRLLEIARKVEADDSVEAFERAFERGVKPKAPSAKPSGRRFRRSGKPASS